MPIPSSLRTRDVLIRVSGLVLILLGSLSLNRLFHCVQALPARACTPAEIALAALGLLCLSPGALFLTLGGHIFDKVAISERWAVRSR